MKKRTLMLLTLCSLFALAGCDNSTASGGGDDNTTNVDDPNTNEDSVTGEDSVIGEDPATEDDPVTDDPIEEPAVTYYTVTVYDGDKKVVSTESVAEGTKYAEPNDSFVGNDNMLRGWYLDSSYTNEASFPITVNSNISLYADVITNEQYFLEARERTVSNGYSYTDTLKIQLTTLSGLLTFNGNRTGEIEARPDQSFSYLAHYKSDGSLLSDGQQYIMHKDGIRQNIKLNKNGELSSYKTESTTEEDDNSVYSKAIFEYDDEDIRALTKVDDNKYQITTTANASSIISSTLNVLGNDYVQDLIEQLPSVSSSFTMYVTYDNGYIDTYTYEFSVAVTGASLTFAYSLDFSAYNQTSALTEPSIENLYLSSSDINNIAATHKTDLNNYKAQNVSEYDYKLNVELEDSDGSYEASVKGTATRAIQDETVYFNNRIETDTSGYSDVEDYDRNRANLLDGTVYSCYRSGFLWLTKNYDLSTYRGDVDDYFLLIDDSLLSSTYIAAGQYLSSKEVYNFVFNEAGVDYMFNFINNQVYLNFESNAVKVMGDYVLSTLSINETQFQISYDDGELDEITIEMSGYIDTTLDRTLENAEFTVTYEISVASISSYDIPEDTDDIEVNY